MTDPRPAPYPADTRAKGWHFGLDCQAINRSDSWALQACGVAHGIYLMLFLEAWQQVPCGTLPNDDVAIARLAGIPIELFEQHRRGVMHEWWLADDGRYYHPLVIVQVNEMLKNRARGYRKHLGAIIERDGYTCRYCGCDNRLTLDHVQPRSRGGSDDQSNLVLACKPCNSSKGAKTIAEWRARETHWVSET